MATGIDEIDTVVGGFPGRVARGSGPRVGRVVFLHGAFTDHTGFDRWLGRFAAAGFDAWAVSRRGRRGVPPANAEGVTVDDYLADTRAVLDALPGEGPLVLVGHSLGGLLGQVLATEGRCDALVAVSPAPPGMLTAQSISLPYFAPKLPSILLGRSFRVPDGGCPVLALNRIPDEAERRRIHRQLVPESGLVYRAMMFGSVRVDASRVRCPVLVLGGEQDRIVSAALCRSTAQHYGATLRLYPQHAHWILEEPGWQEVCDDVLGWLAQHVVARREAC